MTPTGILETVLYASDLEAAEAFYTEVFNLSVIRRLPGKFVFLRCGEQVLLIFDPIESARADPRNPIPRHGAIGPGHVCFRVVDRRAVDAWAERLVELGLVIEHRHEWPTGGVSVYTRDPAGNSVEVAEPLIWTP